MKKRVLLITIGIIAVAYFLYFIAWIIAPGSYPKAEIYELETTENILISIISDLKSKEPTIGLNTDSITNPTGLIDGRSQETGHWYHIYFYDSESDEIIHTWIRTKSESTVSFAFVGINKGLNLGNWTDANESFWWWKNKPMKLQFEKRILSKIKTELNKRKLNNS